MSVFFIAFLTAMGNNFINGDYKLEPAIIGTLLMIFLFYLMNLNSKQKNLMIDI